MRIAIMQPYFFPYIGYFQLINAVDKFIFYDDVNFIKNGWINRNRILINGEPHYITLQLKNASPFKPINQIEFTDNRKKILKTIKQSYIKAPCFNSVWALIEDCLQIQTNNLSDQAINTILSVAKYLDINTIFEYSSIKYSYTYGNDKTDRIIKICKENAANEYINPFGGNLLYNKKDFDDEGITLFFIETNGITYKQFNSIFIPSLSIIDILMFNSKSDIIKMLNNYKFV